MPPAPITHSGSLQRGSVALAYESWGDGEALVCVHGFGADREAMRDLARSVGEGYRVLLLDLRGHGASGVPDVADDEAAYGYPVQCEDLVALLDAEGIERVHWIGHSMGGQLALMAALREPERTCSLVAIAAGPNRPIVDERERRAWARAADRFETMSSADLCGALAAAAPRVERASPTATQAKVPELYARAQGANLARVVRGAFLPMRDNSEACRELQVPALVIAGEEDAQWLEPSRRLAELLPRARLQCIPEAGHLAHLDRRETVARMIREFLN